jgi:hypothetical protein
MGFRETLAAARRVINEVPLVDLKIEWVEWGGLMGAERAMASTKFETKDSGTRQQYASGMHRDTTEGKIQYGLALDGPMFKRYAELMTRGAVKYEARNWMKAAGKEELERFRDSALRHFMQWYNGDRDEDHAAAVIFNLNGAEYVAEKLATPDPQQRLEFRVDGGYNEGDLPVR